jgi:hypothetical protein
MLYSIVVTASYGMHPSRANLTSPVTLTKGIVETIFVSDFQNMTPIGHVKMKATAVPHNTSCLEEGAVATTIISQGILL